MLERVRRFLRRVRRMAPRPERPARRWREDLAEAGLTAEAWIGRRQSSGRLFVDLPDARVTRLRDEEPELVQATLDAASRTLLHEFNLLGSGPYIPRDPDRAIDANGYQPIDWYLDPISGLRFPRGIPHTRWNLDEMRPGTADVKLPWELARCQHWPVLGEAFRLTGDDRYALEIARELGDFMEANPVGVGVNWTCTMDVALRAANWALGLELVRSCLALPFEFWRDTYEALFDHGVFIESNLENTYEVTSNHFLSNVVGLFYVAAVFDDLPRGEMWNSQCRTWLSAEMTVQVLPDGADYESSVPYHRLVTELFLGAARLADYKGEPLPPSLCDRLRSMVEFLAAVRRPDGLMPQIGDADDGRLHILSGYGIWQPQDARHLFGPAACFFRKADWMSLGGQWAAWESAWWGLDCDTDLLPPHAKADAPRQGIDTDGLRHFPAAGLTVMRRRGDYLLVTNGIVGTKGFGNHKHNDLLGFEFHVNGTPILVDPGSYVYTSDKDARNLFRSTRSHNTVSIDDEEQNELRPEWLFRMFEKANPEHLVVAEQDDRFRYRGRHRGYTRLPQPVVHERILTLSRRTSELTIEDAFEGTGAHRLRWHFHFGPGVDVLVGPAGRFTIHAGGTVLEMAGPAALSSTIAPAWYSPSYGVRIPCVGLDSDTEVRLDGRCEYAFRFAS